MIKLFARPATTRRRTGRRSVMVPMLVMLGTLLAFVVSPLGVSPAQAKPKPKPTSNVVVSTDVQNITLEPFPCWKTIVTVSLQNKGDQAVYADAWIDPTGPVQVSRQLVSTYLPPGYTAHSTVNVWIPNGTAPGTWSIKVHNDTTSSTITAVSEGVDTGGNLARTAVVTASSSHAGMPACNTADGNTDSTIWQRTAWFDSNARVFPDWVTYDFGSQTSVSRVELYMLDSARYPAATFALSSYDVQARVGGNWVNVAEVRNNVAGHVTSTFPAVTTDAIRILCLGANDSFYSRIVETEIYA